MSFFDHYGSLIKGYDPFIEEKTNLIFEGSQKISKDKIKRKNGLDNSVFAHHGEVMEKYHKDVEEKDPIFEIGKNISFEDIFKLPPSQFKKGILKMGENYCLLKDKFPLQKRIWVYTLPNRNNAFSDIGYLVTRIISSENLKRNGEVDPDLKIEESEHFETMNARIERYVNNKPKISTKERIANLLYWGIEN